MAEARKRARKASAKRRTRRSAKGKGSSSRKRAGRPPEILATITYTNPATNEEETIAVTELILRQIRTGVPQRYAAQAAGVHEVTLSRWIARGREWLVDGRTPEDAPEAERPYANFAKEVVRARGTAVAFFVAQLNRSARAGSTRAAIEWLRAQAPDEFKKRIGVELEGSDRKPAPLVPEDQETYRRAFAAAYGDKLPEIDPDELAPPEDEREEDGEG